MKLPAWWRKLWCRHEWEMQRHTHPSSVEELWEKLGPVKVTVPHFMTLKTHETVATCKKCGRIKHWVYQT